MEKYVRVNHFGLSKFNNSEYCNLMERFRMLIVIDESGENPEDLYVRIATNKQLGITKDELIEFDRNTGLLADLVNESNISDETKPLAELDKQRTELLIFITSKITLMKRSPNTDEATAAISLYNIIKPYIGAYKSANQQLSAQINGLLIDLAKAGVAELLNKLILTTAVNSLKQVNANYIELTSQRTNKKSISSKENSLVIRTRINTLFYQMLTKAFASSIISPSTEKTEFITKLDGMISEVTTLYNQRIALAKAQRKPSGEDPDDL